MSLKEVITQRAVQSGGTIHIRNALLPILWLCGIITIPVFSMTLYLVDVLPNWLIIMLIVLAYFPVLVAIFAFLYLLFKNPDKLQSEDYQIRKQSLELIQEKGHRFPVNPVSIEVIPNPEHLRSSSPSKEKKEKPK
jgi:hypothetical protein